MGWSRIPVSQSYFLFRASTPCVSRARGPPLLSCYFLCFSMPLVPLLPGLVAQQKTDSSPHFSQTCRISFLAPFPRPTVSIYVLQPGQRCFSPTVITLAVP